MESEQPKKKEPPRRPVKAARYDALTDKNLFDHWRWVDSRSVDASLDPDTRRRMRERARYEVANNSYAMGVALGLSNAIIGTGPRLQIVSGLDRDKRQQTELDFEAWMQEVGLAEILRAMAFAKTQDGETFGLMYTNQDLTGPVKLGFMPIDAERVAGEYMAQGPYEVDGITLNQYGRPLSYRILTRHPGDVGRLDLSGATKYVEEAAIYPAWQVVHWFRRTTAEQHRGASELVAALNLFALLRRYTLAVVTAAETAADFAAIMYTDSPGDFGGDSASPTPFETFDIERGLMMTAPDGWKVAQLKSEQPTTTYKEFKRELLGEIGRSLQIPVNVITGDSSQHNYASGRLDYQEYHKAILTSQKQASVAVMRPIFRQWWREYSIVYGLPRAVPQAIYYWDGFEHVDPVKEARAQETRLRSLTTTLAAEYAKQGKDWEEELTQIAREREKMRELGLEFGDITPDLEPEETN